MKKTSPDKYQEPKDIVSLSKALRAAQQLVIYRKVLSDPIVSSLLELLDQLDRNTKLTRKGLLRITESYATFFSRLAERTALRRPFGLGSPWQDHLLDLIFNDENLFSSRSQVCSPGNLGKSLVSQVEVDLTRLQRLYQVDSESVVSALRKADPAGEWLRWDELGGTPPNNEHALERYSTAQLLHEAMPFLVEVGVLLDLIVGIFVMGIVMNHIQREFSSLDTERLAELRD